MDSSSKHKGLAAEAPLEDLSQPAAPNVGDDVAQPRRKCLRKRRRSTRGQAKSSVSGSNVSKMPTQPAPSSSSGLEPLPCIIGWNSHMSKAEEDLQHAVILSVAAVVASRDQVSISDWRS